MSKLEGRVAVITGGGSGIDQAMAKRVVKESVAGRFGLCGSFEQPNVALGDFSHFVAFTRILNWFMPSATIPALAWSAIALRCCWASRSFSVRSPGPPPS